MCWKYLRSSSRDLSFLWSNTPVLVSCSMLLFVRLIFAVGMSELCGLIWAAVLAQSSCWPIRCCFSVVRLALKLSQTLPTAFVNPVKRKKLKRKWKLKKRQPQRPQRQLLSRRSKQLRKWSQENALREALAKSVLQVSNFRVILKFCGYCNLCGIHPYHAAAILDWNEAGRAKTRYCYVF